MVLGPYKGYKRDWYEIGTGSTREKYTDYKVWNTLDQYGCWTGINLSPDWVSGIAGKTLDRYKCWTGISVRYAWAFT